MALFALGTLSSDPASLRPDLLAAPTRLTLARAGLLAQVGVAEIDPALSETAATQLQFGLEPDTLANCVVVGGKREGNERLAACVVLADSRADINGVVKRLLDVRKASFLTVDRAVGLTGMEHGGITPIGLPAEWRVLIDRRVIETEIVVIGSGVRRSKILIPGCLLGELPQVEIIDELGGVGPSSGPERPVGPRCHYSSCPRRSKRKARSTAFPLRSSASSYASARVAASSQLSEEIGARGGKIAVRRQERFVTEPVQRDESRGGPLRQADGDGAVEGDDR